MEASTIGRLLCATVLLAFLHIAEVRAESVPTKSESFAGVNKSTDTPAPTAVLARRPKAKVYAFFATWCVPCRVELPHLERLHQKYKDMGLELLLVSEDAPSTAQSVPSFLARFDVTAKWVVDSDSEILSRYNPSGGIPFTVLLDGEGGVAWAHAGYEPGDEDLLESKLKKVLESHDETTKSAQKVTWSVTSQSLAIWRESRFQIGDSRTQALAERLEVGARTKTLRLSARFDADFVDDSLERETNFRPERGLLTYDNRYANLRLGDDYVQFGHGLALSLRKIDALGLDTTLRGGQAEINLSRTRVKLIAGITNRQNLDSIDLQVTDDEQDLLVGTEITVSVTDDISVSPYVMLADAEAAATDGSDIRWMAFGLATSLALGKVTLAAEGAGGTREGFTAEGNQETIWAGYGSAQIQEGDLSLLVDAKAYRNWAIGRTRNERPILYHEAPTLERDDQQVPSNDNAIGARTRVEWRIPSRKSTVFANLLGYRYTQDGTSARHGDNAVHGYLGSELRLGESASIGVQTGYRDENKEDGSDKLSLYHFDLDFATSLSDKLSATFKWNHQEEEKVVFNTLDFRRGLVIGGLAWSGVAAAALLYGYSTEQATTPTHYPGAELLLHLPRGGVLRFFGGRLVGGRVCVSGSCRDVPPFEGVRMDLVVNL